MLTVRIGNRHIQLKTMLDEDLAKLRRQRRFYEAVHALVSATVIVACISGMIALAIVYAG